MEVAIIEDKKTLSNWSKRDKKAPRHKLPNDIEKPVVDYDKLRQLCAIEGLADRNNEESTEAAHQQFMQMYSSIFVKPEKKLGLPIHSLNRSAARAQSDASLGSKSAVGKTTHYDAIQKEYPVDKMTHDIGDYLSELRHERRSERPEVVKAERIKTMRKILKKLPFERSATENDQLLACLKNFPDLASQVTDHVLKELCVVCYLESWKEDSITVFGNSGWHIILKGSVQPQVYPWRHINGEDKYVPDPTPPPGQEKTDPKDLPELRVGDAFGTLEKLESASPRILTVLTKEQNCEFLKVSCSDYAKVMEQIEHRDETEKVNLLQSCKTFGLWSRQPLIKVASLVEWVDFPANTVLVSEGYKAPFIGIIKSGECHVLRQVEVLVTLNNGKKDKRTKQVVMGKLGVSESFGEISVMTEEPISCSIITASAVKLGSLEPEKLAELDNTTRQLLLQSSEPTFGNLKPTDIHEEYVEQELKREWNQFKHNVVVDVINSRGIRPGFGKWSK